MEVTDRFDAYHQWLGISPANQPPTNYRLLGLQEYEPDPDVIRTAADRQSAYLRSVQAGPHAAQAAELLDAVANARMCLTNPQQKSNYDAVLNSAAPADAASADHEPSLPLVDDAPKPGTEFGLFQVIERIRSSRYGNVYKARHRDSGRLVSLKILSRSAAKNNVVLKRFEREQKITLDLNHPNLITGYAKGVHHGQPFLVTEYVVGTDLATLVRQQGQLSVDVAEDYIQQAARGLTQLHMHGIYHRNIKPNILFVDMQGRIKITSLFLARLDEFATVSPGNEELTQMGQMMGTAEYMAPEQAIDAKHADGRADTYSLGCTLFFLLTGRPPYGGKSPMDKIAAHKTKPIPALSSVRRDVPRRLDRVFRRMLAKDPLARFQFMGDVVAVLEPKPNKNIAQRFLIWLADSMESR